MPRCSSTTPGHPAAPDVGAAEQSRHRRLAVRLELLPLGQPPAALGEPLVLSSCLGCISRRRCRCSRLRSSRGSGTCGPRGMARIIPTARACCGRSYQAGMVGMHMAAHPSTPAHPLPWRQPSHLCRREQAPAAPGACGPPGTPGSRVHPPAPTAAAQHGAASSHKRRDEHRQRDMTGCRRMRCTARIWPLEDALYGTDLATGTPAAEGNVGRSPPVPRVRQTMGRLQAQMRCCSIGFAGRRPMPGSPALLTARGRPPLGLPLPGPSTTLALTGVLLPPRGRKAFTTSDSMCGWKGVPPSSAALVAAAAALLPLPGCAAFSASSPASPPAASCCAAGCAVPGSASGGNSAANWARAASVGLAAGSSSPAAALSAISSWQKRLLPSSACKAQEWGRASWLGAVAKLWHILRVHCTALSCRNHDTQAMSAPDTRLPPLPLQHMCSSAPA